MSEDFKNALNTLNWTEAEFDVRAGADIRATLAWAFVALEKQQRVIEYLDISQQQLDDLNLRLDLIGAS